MNTVARPGGGTKFKTQEQAGARKGRYHHGALREALVRSAAEILQERGLEKLTLRECARRAGVSHGAPAHHFQDITGLLSEVAASGFEQLRSLMALRQEQAGDDPALRLRASGAAYIEFALNHRALFRLMFRSERVALKSARLRRAAKGALAVLSRSLDAVARVRDGTRPPLEQAARVLLAWSLVHGFVTLLLEEQLSRFQGRRSQAAFAREMGDRMLRLVRLSWEREA